MVSLAIIVLVDKMEHKYYLGKLVTMNVPSKCIHENEETSLVVEGHFLYPLSFCLHSVQIPKVTTMEFAGLSNVDDWNMSRLSYLV
jgi:hypothetical protein